MQVITCGTSRAAHCRYLFAFCNFLAFRHIEGGCMHVNRVQTVSMVYHDIVAHAAAVGGRNYCSAVSCQNRTPPRRCHIQSVVELLNPQNRMCAVSVFI